MQSTPRFIMIGGFLGAGKTTTIARLANHFQSHNKNVIIVTNDQSTDLVDTQFLRAKGYQVGEVTGSCFCCSFNDLTKTVEELGQTDRPDIILAEPVGSCTDLVATVIRPLQQIYQQPLTIAPYGVIVKPSHGLRILSGHRKGGFSPQAEYIFRKQIEEADYILINRIDELQDADIEELRSLVTEQFGDRPLACVSAKTGQGFESLHDLLGKQGEFGKRLMDVDYDIYAAGEAELGWLNCQLELSAAVPIDLDAFLLTLLNQLKDDFKRLQAETAHLKVIGMSDGYYAVANLVSSDTEPTNSLESSAQVQQAQLVINARIAIDPETLTAQVKNGVEIVAQECGAKATINTLQSFRPGKPVPTHRITNP